MKINVLMIIVLLLIITVNSQNIDEKIETDDLFDLSEDPLHLFTRLRHDGGNDLRHRRKRRQFGYGYNYPPPPPSYYDRRDGQYLHDLLAQILTFLDEISAYVKRPSSPPQPIYVPYLVPQYQCSCPNLSKTNSTELPSVHQRWPVMEDTNQNWGFVETEENPDAGGDGSRPIAFDPITPIQITKRPQYGRSQPATQNPLSVEESSSPPRKPSRCDAVVLFCCRPSSSSLQQQKCFNSFGCNAYYTRENVCNSENVGHVLSSFKKTYCNA